jgi:hypothetical protein
MIINMARYILWFEPRKSLKGKDLDFVGFIPFVRFENLGVVVG